MIKLISGVADEFDTWTIRYEGGRKIEHHDTSQDWRYTEGRHKEASSNAYIILKDNLWRDSDGDIVTFDSVMLINRRQVYAVYSGLFVKTFYRIYVTVIAAKK